MKVDGGVASDLAKAGPNAQQAEAAGYSGLWTAETNHDPFLPLLLAAEHTDRVELGTSIAVAFARNPMLLANTAWDLQAYSGGRFILGLGSQIKPHITKRFSMPWSHPAPRMREMVLAIRAIWDCWLNGTKLEFRGDFYTHTLMTPFFTPDRGDLAEVGVPRIFLAGVGELMTEVAGEVCDGFICHGFTTERYLREVTLPALEREDGRRPARPWRASRSSGRASSSPAATRPSSPRPPPAPASRSPSTARRPPTGRCSTCTVGAGCRTSSTGCPSRAAGPTMGDLIDDEILNTFAVVAEPEAVAAGAAAPLRRRHPAHLASTPPVPQRPRPLAPVIDALKAACSLARRQAQPAVRPGSSVSSRYCSRHLARCSLPEEVLGSVPGLTSITSRGGMPQTSSVRWWISWRMAVEVGSPCTSATTTTDSLPL